MMKLYILALGELELSAKVLDGARPASQRATVPVWGLLLRHAAGNLIFDLGCMENAMEGGWRESARRSMDFRHAPSETIRGQLALLGLKPEDVETVVVSHLHDDHFGGIDLFCHADVYVPREEWVRALVSTHVTADEGAHAAYRRQMELPVKRYHLVGIGEDFELFPGVELLTLPGHTENLLGLCVKMRDRTLLFPSDCLYTPDSAAHPPAHCADSARYQASAARIFDMERALGAKVIYSHWPEQYAALPKAPRALAEDGR